MNAESDRARAQESTEGSLPSRWRRLAFGPRFGFGGGPEIGVCLIILVVLAFAGGSTPKAQTLWPFGGSFAGIFDDRPASERAPEVLAESIRTRTANAPANERTLARRYAAELRRAGIESGVIDAPGRDGGPAGAIAWGRLRGKGDRPALALLSHLDTVAADPEEWSVDPYAGEIWDDFVWGRGALDAKGVGVTHLMSLVALAESELELDRDLVFLATPGEESGGREGAGWLVEHHPELLKGVGYLLTEGGGIQTSHGRDAASRPLWGVSVVEKAPCWLELKAEGRGGHSSNPTKDAAVPRLIAALDRIRRVESPLHVTPEVERMFTSLAPTAAEWDRPGYLFLETTLAKDEGFKRRFLADPGKNALVRNTVSITVLEGAPATNVAPASARAQLDARLLPGETCSSYAQAIRSIVHDADSTVAVTVEEILSFPAIASSPDSDLYRAIEYVAGQQPEPGLVVPRMIGGFTDAHWFRERGIVAYGFVPRALTADEAARVHGADERVAVATLQESIELTIEIAQALDSVESGRLANALEADRLTSLR